MRAGVGLGCAEAASGEETRGREAAGWNGEGAAATVMTANGCGWESEARVGRKRVGDGTTYSLCTEGFGTHKEGFLEWWWSRAHEGEGRRDGRGNLEWDRDRVRGKEGRAGLGRYIAWTECEEGERSPTGRIPNEFAGAAFLPIPAARDTSRAPRLGAARQTAVSPSFR